MKTKKKVYGQYYPWTTTSLVHSPALAIAAEALAWFLDVPSIDVHASWQGTQKCHQQKTIPEVTFNLRFLFLIDARLYAVNLRIDKVSKDTWKLRGGTLGELVGEQLNFLANISTHGAWNNAEPTRIIEVYNGLIGKAHVYCKFSAPGFSSGFEPKLDYHVWNVPETEEPHEPFFNRTRMCREILRRVLAHLLGRDDVKVFMAVETKELENVPGELRVRGHVSKASIVTGIASLVWTLEATFGNIRNAPVSCVMWPQGQPDYKITVNLFQRKGTVYVFQASTSTKQLTTFGLDLG